MIELGREEENESDFWMRLVQWREPDWRTNDHLIRVFSSLCNSMSIIACALCLYLSTKSLPSSLC